MTKRIRIPIFLILTVSMPSLLAGWVEDGVEITYATFSQRYPQIAYTGGGNAIIVWEDDRNYYTEDTNIYAQRVDTTGTIHWIVNGLPVCRAEGVQETPKICPDGAGGVYICWEDLRNENVDIYVQRIGSDGLPLWDLNGIPVTTDTMNQYQAEIMADGSGGVIIVWTDGRDVLASGYNIFAQRFDADGNTIWAPGGNAVCEYDYAQYEPKAVPDGEGGVFVVWRDGRFGGYPSYDSNSLFMARLDADGVKMYELDLIVWDYDQLDPAIVPVGDGSYIVAWMDSRDVGDWDLYVQRVSRGGMKLWSEDGAPLCTADESQSFLRGVSDGGGGAIFVWNDGRSGTNDVYAGLIDSSAVQPWGADGIPVCVENGHQMYPEIVSDNSGGAVVCWEDRRIGYDVYAQRIDTYGTALWAAGGAVICDEGSNQFYPQLCSDGDSGALITWMDIRVGDWDIYASLVTGDGDLVATLLQSFSAAARDNGIIIEWRLSEMDPGTRFSIERSDMPDGVFVEIDGAAIEIDGLSCTFEDYAVMPGREYQYIVLVTDDSGTRELFRTDIFSIPRRSLTLHQNYPNPFNPTTTISFYLPERCAVDLAIYDVTGRLVARLLDGETRDGGRNTVTWDGRDGSGRKIATGVYLYRLRAGKTMLTRKILLLK